MPDPLAIDAHSADSIGAESPLSIAMDDARTEAAVAESAPPGRRWFRRRPGSWPFFSGTVLGLFAFVGLFGMFFTPHDPDLVALNIAKQPPVFAGGTWSYPLGTDELGRDLLSRLIAGAHVSFLVSIAAVAIAGGIGLLIALLSGFNGGRLDALLMRFADGSMAFPSLLFAVVMVATFGASLTVVVIVLVLAGWPQYARVLRSEILTIRSRDFVTMARVMGGSKRWIIAKHVLPNIVGTLLVLATLQMGLAIIAEGSLSFLGIGVPPPAASWGGILASGRTYLSTAWWIPVLPAICLSVTVLAANLFGDWLRMRFDPTTRR